MFDVCLLTTGFPRFEGDLFGSFVFELARALQRRGLQVAVLAPHERGIPRREDMDGVYVKRFRYFLPRWQRLAYGGGMPTNLRESWMARLQVPFFLVAFCWNALRMAPRSNLFHCQWTISGLVGYLSTRWIRRPVILTVRGSDFHLTSSGAGTRLNRFIYQHMTSVLTVSQDLARQMSASDIVADLHVVTNGVDARFHPQDAKGCRAELGLPDEGFIVLFVGLLVPVKGLDHLLDGLQQLLDLPLTCVLVGDGPLEEHLRGRLADGLEDRVVFAGRQSALEVPKWMAAADLFVLPSLSEGRPNVVLEAQACGLPVIATAVGGTPELIEDGVSGMLVAPGDAGALANAIRVLVMDSALRQRLGLAARERIVSGEYSWDASAERTCQIYTSVLGG